MAVAERPDAESAGAPPRFRAGDRARLARRADGSRRAGGKDDLAPVEALRRIAPGRTHVRYGRILDGVGTRAQPAPGAGFCDRGWSVDDVLAGSQRRPVAVRQLE